MRKFTRTSVIVLAILLTGCAATKNPATHTKTLEKKKTVAEINIELGMAYLENKDVQQAKQKLLLAMNEDPSLPEVQYSMAYFYEMTGEKQLANEYYLRAIALAPQRGDSQNNYGTYLCRRRDYQNAILHFKMAVRDPGYLDTAGAYENAGLCALKIPDEQQALEYFNHAIAQDSNRPVSLFQAAELYFKQGNYAAAKQNLQEYLQIAPANRATAALSAQLRKQRVIA